MHRIRLYQSNWADAQSLMHRWGEWGHYDGQCTPEACLYQIVLGSLAPEAASGSTGLLGTTGSRPIPYSVAATPDWLPHSQSRTAPFGERLPGSRLVMSGLDAGTETTFR